jgi:hypothetical protein
MTNKKISRYFVGRVGDGWDNPSYQYNRLSTAIREAFECKVTGDFEGGSGPIFVAKEISYEVQVDEKTGKVKIIPVDDIKSSKPYYLIKDYRGTVCTYGGNMDWDCHSVKSSKDLQKLIVQNGLPRLGAEFHLAHGLEVKLEEGKRGQK